MKITGIINSAGVITDILGHGSAGLNLRPKAKKVGESFTVRGGLSTCECDGYRHHQFCRRAYNRRSRPRFCWVEFKAHCKSSKSVDRNLGDVKEAVAEWIR